MQLKFKKIHWGDLVKRIFVLWLKHYKLLFFISFLIVAGLGGYEWRKSLFAYAWSPEERKAYLEKTIKETVFHEDKFLMVLEKLSVLRDEHTKSIAPQKNLFIQARDKE
jgi:hypothetical protein